MANIILTKEEFSQEVTDYLNKSIVELQKMAEKKGWKELDVEECVYGLLPFADSVPPRGKGFTDAT